MGPLSFSAPLILAALIALPALWFLLRVTPPAPSRVRFPAYVILQRLQKTPETPSKTPWPILLLRLAVAALTILALSGPILNASPPPSTSAPLMVVVDDSFIAAPGWRRLAAQMETIAEQSVREGRPLFLLRTAGGGDDALQALSPADFREAIARGPAPLRPDYAKAAERLAALPLAGAEINWYADGVAHDGSAAFLEALRARGAVTLRVDETLSRLALFPPVSDAAGIAVSIRSANGRPWRGAVVALARDGRELGRADVIVLEGARTGEARIDLPLALQNEVAEIRLDGVASAGAVQLADARERRALVGFMATGEVGADPLLSGQHYVRKALEPYARFVTDTLEGLIAAEASAIVLDNVGVIRPGEVEALTQWIEKGGVLIRFSGAALAEAAAEGKPALIPAPLRGGGRAFGGALTWETPQRLGAFSETGPFFDMAAPDDVLVRRQILAEPGAEAAARAWASLADGTPLVTGERLGAGALALFHVTATPDWSDLPLSPTFIEMLRRLIFLSALGPQTDEALKDRVFQPLRVMDGYGALKAPPRGAAGVTLSEIAAGPAAGRLPGLYGAPEAPVALNALRAGDSFEAVAFEGVPTRGFVDRPPQRLAGPLLAVALLLFALDAIVALFLSGRLRTPAAAAIAAVMLAGPFPRAEAQPLDAAIAPKALDATLATRLAFVETGDPTTDAASLAGLQGLTRELERRTSLEPAAPAAIDPETDDISVYQFLYWPIVAGAPTPSDQAVASVESFMRFGGLIVFDTRDDERAVAGTETPEREALQAILRRLDIPPLTPLPPDHVLLRSFYLLPDLPGRMVAGHVWVQAGEGPNDSVTPLIIGGRDWAGAWASDALARPLFPMTQGGERARAVAMRAGINMAMVAFTGNYKLDQVHTPILLERLGRE